MGLTGDMVSVPSPTASPEALGLAGLGARKRPVPTIKLARRRVCLGSARNSRRLRGMCSLPSQVVVRKASCLPQSISTCETVSGPMPQGHSSVSTAWIVFRYCRRAIFPVRIWISTAESSLLSPLYNCRHLRSTSGSNCRSWCPCFAFVHSFFQSSFALARAHLVTADCSGCSGGNV